MTSPIEAIFRKALISHLPANMSLYDMTKCDTSKLSLMKLGNNLSLHLVGGTCDDEEYEEYGEGPFALTIYSQMKVASYRLDFLISCGDSGWLAVECDGHNWHSTKQQIAYDRSRDRELAFLGLPLFRYTGSELTHTAERCVNEIYPMALRIFEVGQQEIDAYDAGFKAGILSTNAVVTPALPSEVEF